MNLNKCKNELPFISADHNPNCLPDNIEDWFINLRESVENAQTQERLMCIMDLARDVEKKCKANPFTKEFLPKAYQDIMEAAKAKLSSISSKEELLTFSSGRGSASSLDALLDEFKKENSRRLPWF